MLPGVRFIGMVAGYLNMLEAVPRPVEIAPKAQVPQRWLALVRNALRSRGQRLKVGLADQGSVVPVLLHNTAHRRHVLGQFDTYQFATNGPVPETLGQFTDTTAQWYLMLYNNTNTNSVAYWTRIDGPPEERISAEVSNLKTSTSSSQVNIAVDRGSVGSQGSFDLYETHALVLTRTFSHTTYLKT